MKCCTVQHKLKPDRDISGESSNCTATLSGLIGDNMKRILLTQGKYAIVDDEDFEWLNQWKWQAQKHSYDGYRAMRGAGGRKNQRTVYMHRVIMNAPKGLEVDHINHDTLDNQRKNLRLVTQSQNQQNSKKRKNCSSKYKGVHWHKLTRKWRSKISSLGEPIHLGLYKSEIGAAKAYDKKAIELFGEFAYLNFPKEFK